MVLINSIVNFNDSLGLFFPFSQLLWCVSSMMYVFFCVLFVFAAGCTFVFLFYFIFFIFLFPIASCPLIILYVFFLLHFWPATFSFPSSEVVLVAWRLVVSSRLCNRELQYHNSYMPQFGENNSPQLHQQYPSPISSKIWLALQKSCITEEWNCHTNLSRVGVPITCQLHMEGIE